MGGSGVIPTAGNIIPREMHRMVQYWLDGQWSEAARMQREYKDLIDALFCEVNPIPVKAALGLMGKLIPEYRLPLCDPSDATMTRLKQVLTGYGLIS